MLAFAALLSLAVGARSIPFGDVVDALLHGGDTQDATIIRDLRVPRTLLGIAVGAALGVAGALMQALTRNPLADPGLLGVNAGASAAVVIALRSGSPARRATSGSPSSARRSPRSRCTRSARPAAAARRPSGSRSPARRSPRR